MEIKRMLEKMYLRLDEKVDENEEKILNNVKEKDPASFEVGLGCGTIAGMKMMLKFLAEEIETMDYDAF